MPHLSRPNLWTFSIVTVASILVWSWAAFETREDGIFYPKVRLEVAGSGEWRISQTAPSVTVEAEGSALTLRRAAAAAREPLLLDIPATVGTQSVSLEERIREHPTIRETGVVILSVEPSELLVDVDEVVSVPAAVRPVMPGILTEGDIEIRPNSVTARVPSLLRRQLPDDLVVEAFVDPALADRLAPGTRQTLEDIRLRLPESLAGTSIELEPSMVSMSFTLRSRTRPWRVETARIQLAGPPEDFLEYELELRPAVLREVTIHAETDVVRALEAGQAQVVAVVHLSNRDKEQRIKQKQVAYFLVLADGWTRGIPVTGTVEGVEGMPVVELDIRRREE